MLALCAALLALLCLWVKVRYSPVWKEITGLQLMGVAYRWYADELGKKANDPTVVTEILVYLIAFATMTALGLTFVWIMNRWDSASSDD